ncbi:hypothetical protein MN116_005826 [Schistosoma mekongi]|uniref:Protein FAM221B n=1 Tax=Schistosoma mekongi TaxID=38744 RepID=A0AAE1ZBB3_SCHME|nr:hypothetical protein MN116_005826 [Schistosoma mekongi]
MSNTIQNKSLSTKQTKRKKEKQSFLTDKDYNIIPGTYRTPVGEVRITKIASPKRYDVISLVRSINENFAPRTKELFTPEIEAVKEAMKTGTYIAWRPIDKPWNQQDCQRVCRNSRCFCGHLLNQHDSFSGKITVPRCNHTGCLCTGFKFIPSRPEEVGEFWITKRSDFDRSAYRVKCKCKHTHEEHVSYPVPYQCKIKGCKCSGFSSAFLCAACDKHWNEHETVFESEMERKAEGRPVGEAWLPFAELPELAKIALTGVDNPDVQTIIDALPTSSRQNILEQQTSPALCGIKD